VRREEFDVLVKFPAVDLVLDSVVGEMHLVVGLYATLPISRTYLSASPSFVRSILSKVNH
jgi:hypothetical protein